jgi:hypothetical protein
MDAVTRSRKLHPFTVEDMVRFAGEAWGELGIAIVSRWCEFNATYFDNALKPVPLVITNTMPYGKRIGFCSYDPDATGRTITLNVPKDKHQLLADNNTLLHEMVHQFLCELGEYPSHDGNGWRREITRLTRIITGNDIWVGPSKTMRRNGRVVRMNAPHPETNVPSLTQGVIARWPHDAFGIDFGQLGKEHECNSELHVTT